MGIIYENKFNYEGMVDKIPTYTLQEKEVEITENGQLVINPDEGYDCLTSVTANVNVPSSGGEYDIEVIENDDGTQELNIADASSTPKPLVEKDVNFYDFDGSLVYSFAKNSMLAMASLPEPPDHSTYGVPLMSKGWNWTLEEIKEQLIHVEGNIDVGALYTPVDGNTHIVCEVNDYKRKTVHFEGSYGSFIVDWGDGTVETGSLTSSKNYVTHTYIENGTYYVSIETSVQVRFDKNLSNDPVVGFIIGPKNSCPASWNEYARNIRFIITDELSKSPNRAVYNNQTSPIKKLIIGRTENVNSMSSYGLSLCGDHLIFPGCVKSIKYVLGGATKPIESYTFPYTLETLEGGSIFGFVYVKRVILPQNLKVLGNVFSTSYASTFVLKPTTPPQCNTSGMFNTSYLYKIIVPKGCLEAYQNATNWSTYAEYMVEEE